MEDPKSSGVLRFELPNARPLPSAARHNWGVWRDILSGHSPSERAALLREAARGFGDPLFAVSATFRASMGSPNAYGRRDDMPVAAARIIRVPDADIGCGGAIAALCVRVAVAPPPPCDAAAHQCSAM